MGTVLTAGFVVSVITTITVLTVPTIRARFEPAVLTGIGSSTVFFLIAALAYPATGGSLIPTLLLAGLFEAITLVLLNRAVTAWETATALHSTPTTTVTVPVPGPGEGAVIRITEPVAPDQPGTGILPDGTTRIVHSEEQLPVGVTALVVEHITDQAVEARPIPVPPAN